MTPNGQSDPALDKAAIREHVVDEGVSLFAFVDRMGGFFRVRGENVSSYEVEKAMMLHPAVRAAAAVPVPAVIGEEDDIAVFLELHENAKATISDFESHARDVMPPYMRPKYIRTVAALPVTPTLKIEKYKLKARLTAELAGAV